MSDSTDPSLQPPPEPQVTTLGRYRLLKPLGRGGMAEVYLAEVSGPQGFKKRVALKVVLPGLQATTEMEEMFFKEARVAAEFAHPNIIQVYDFGEIDQRYFIAMEYAEGMTLHGLVRRRRKQSASLSAAVVATVGAQLASALTYLHERTAPDGSMASVIHRDISPENVFLTRDGFVKLIDFGIAKVGDASGFTHSGTFAGKPAYMSPEQAQGLALGCPSDIFSLGATLWEAVAQRKLFEGEMLKLLNAIAHEPAPQLEEVAPGTPIELCSVIMSMLAKDPASRPPAAKVQKALERFLLLQEVSSPQSLLSKMLRDSSGSSETALEASAVGGYIDLEVAGVIDLSPDSGPVLSTRDFDLSGGSSAPAPLELDWTRSNAHSTAIVHVDDVEPETEVTDLAELRRHMAPKAEVSAPPSPVTVSSAPPPVAPAPPKPSAVPLRPPPPQLDPSAPVLVGVAPVRVAPAIRPLPAPASRAPAPKSPAGATPVKSDRPILSSPSPELPASPPSPVTRSSSKLPMGLAIGGVVVLLVGAGAWMLSHPSPLPAEPVIAVVVPAPVVASPVLAPLPPRPSPPSQPVTPAPTPSETAPAAIEPPAVEVSVETDPVGAQILVDGTLQAARTPAQVSLRKGEAHEIQATLEGYLAARVAVPATQGDGPVRLKLQPEPRIKLLSVPPGTVTNSIGTVLGETPLELPARVVRGGVVVSRAGFLSKEIQPTGNPSLDPIKLVLVPAAVLSVVTTPPGVALELDGVDTGKVTPADLSLAAAAPHKLVLRRKSFISVTRAVKPLAKGRTMRVEITLHNTQLDELAKELDGVYAQIHRLEKNATFDKTTNAKITELTAESESLKAQIEKLTIDLQ